VSPATAPAHDVHAPAYAWSVLALRCAVVLLMGILALAPSAWAVDEPTPDPSLDVRPDPAPSHSQTAPAEQQPAPAKQRPAPAKERPAPAEQRPAPVQQRPAPVQQRPAPVQQHAAPVQQQAAPSAPRYVAPPSPTRRTSSPPSATTRSSRGQKSAAARARRSHERVPRTSHAFAIAALQRLSPARAPARLLRPPSRAASRSDDTGAWALLFAGLALLLFVAASGSLVHLATRDVGRDPRP
jgi:outer membrane biosynthesis protein TonB